MSLRSKNKVSANFSMSSMTDIVFLLLIFFMLASTLVTTSAIDIILPKASGKTENKKSVAVNITEDLTFYIDNKRVMEDMLENELINTLSNQEKPTIVLRAEKTVPVQYVVTIMDIANRNKIKVILAVTPN